MKRIAVLFTVLSIAAIRVDAQWPQFRGPEGRHDQQHEDPADLE